MAAARTARLAASSSTRSPEISLLGGLRRLAAILALSTVLAQPLAAQDRTTLPELESLIPDTAIDNPEDWAKKGVPPAASQNPQPTVQPDTPLADMPLITVPWPDKLELPQLAPLTPEPGIQFAEPEQQPRGPREGTDVRVANDLLLVFPTDAAQFPERDAFVDRFKSLSTVVQYKDNGSAARLAAQAKQDQSLLERMLRVYGYYDAIVFRSISGGLEGAQSANASQPSVRFDIIPGKQYAVGAIDLGDLAAAGPDYPMLRKAFGINTGDPLLQDKIETEQSHLDLALGEGGYPFAAIADPSLLIDHAREQGDLTMKVTPGGKYDFGKVTSNLPHFMSGKHLSEIARFKPGDQYKRSLQMDLRSALQATGLVASTELTPVEVTPPMGDQPGVVDIAAKMTKAKVRTITGSLGYDTGAGFKAEGSWEQRNLFPPEGGLKVRAIAGTQEQLFGVTFRRNNFHGRDKVLTVDAFASTIHYQAYDSRTTSLIGTFERLSNILFQKPFSWSVGAEATATAERARLAGGGFGPRQTYFVGALHGFAELDTSDNLLNPTHGWRLSGRLSPTTSRTNGNQSVYVEAHVEGDYYLPVGKKIVLAARAHAATIAGAPISAIAPSRRLYAGGGGSVRGYAYESIGPHDDQNDPTGGRSLLELSAEARIQTGFLAGALQVVPFVDAGSVGTRSTPSLQQVKIGAGLGVRYLTSFGPVRIDVGVPLNPGPKDGKIGVYVGLGQAF
ncbi:MAG TPA: BamA/TamA family outer membrane protein [Croceibacterium sp.]|jgi:translocation and assembly module TamA